MQMTVFSDFVTGLMAHMRVDQTGLAERLGVTQSTVSRWFKDSEPQQKTLRRIQQLALEVGYSPEGMDTLPLVAVPMKQGVTYVKIRSFVGAGAEIERIEGAEDVLEEIALPWIDGEEYEGVIVRGNSMFPVYRTNDILIFKRHDDDLRRLLNRECVIELEDGRRFVKVLRHGSEPGRYNLDSYNEPVIPNVAVRQAIRIEFVKRAESAV